MYGMSRLCNRITAPPPTQPFSGNRQKPQTKSHEQVGGFELTEGYIHGFFFFFLPLQVYIVLLHIVVKKENH